MYRIRQLNNQTDEGTKMSHMMGAYPPAQRIREAFGAGTPAGNQARNEADMSLRTDKSRAFQVGQFAGTAAADLTQDTTRRFYWLLNALQASGEVINEQTLSYFNKLSKNAPDLYGKHTVLDPDTGKRVGEKTIKIMNEKGKVTGTRSSVDKNSERAAELGIIQQIDGEFKPKRGYSWDSEAGEWKQRNFPAGFVQSLAIPSGIAINTGLGLMTPFGGAEGYKAANPSEEDPTKADNVLTEIGLKYFMGRTGSLLPYDEFKQVRPDVSEDEYRRYQAFKYDKNTDLNPLDGDVTLLAGAIKATDEGIHGPELQFLGRGLPVTTGVVPFLGAVAGGAAGVMRPRPIRGGFVGGMAGLAAGQIGGNLIEQERRRRNAAENGIELN